ncbi:MAG: mechanosensitive ion channel [Kiloniellaceae bacterium]
MAKGRFFAFVAWMALAVCALPLTAAAQEPAKDSIVITLPAEMTPGERQALLEALAALGQLISVEDAAAAEADVPAESRVALAMTRWDAALASWRDLPGLVERWWLGLSAERRGGASLLVVGAMVLALAFGAACEWLFDRLLARWRRRCTEATPTRFSRRAGYGLAWAGLEVLGIAAFAGGALLLAWALLPALHMPRLTLVIILAVIAKARLALTIARFILAPHHPVLRLAPMLDEEARLAWFWIFVTVVVIAFAQGARDVLLGAGAAWETGALLGICMAAFAAGVRLLAIYRMRQPFRNLILRAYGPREGEASGLVKFSANLWHLFYAVLVVINFFALIYAGLLSGETRFATFAVGSFLILCLAPFVIGGYGALIDDLLLSGERDSRHLGAAGALKAFGQGILLLATITLLARIWGADPFAGPDAGLLSRAAAAILQIGGAALLGWTIWQGSKLAIDHYAAEEEEDDQGVSEDAMGKPGSRIATVLPVIRAFLFVAIITLSVLMALSALGVNIGPLLAGAGVIGLAIGFGAQTLVKDIITGLFYLLEDAFRKGEYVQCSAGKGVVEKISLRSVQLRHHNGPLHTIPFGSMGNITNHSRDWVRVKFKIKVPFDTDLNKMRKAIKKVGQEMEADPELGPMFLQPLKSQGVFDTDDTGFITSVKFMSRPGEQFVLRREAFARIQKAFKESGIEFAAPRVTVDSDDEEHRQAAAAAAAAKAAGGATPGGTASAAGD